MLGSALRWLIERSGYDVESFGSSFGLINRARRPEAWFSYWSTLRTLFDDLGVTMVIDVGANTGQFAQRLRSFYSGPIHSFEPESSSHELLAARAAGDSQWQVYRVALGAESAEQMLHVSPSTDFSSLLPTNDYCVQRFGENARPNRSERVQVRRLADILPTLSARPADERIFLKIDTQGYDLPVFRGLGDAAPHVVAVQSELSLIPIYEQMPHWTECLTQYERAGFGVVGMFPVSIDNGRVIEYDCLLARACDTRGPARQ